MPIRITPELFALALSATWSRAITVDVLPQDDGTFGVVVGGEDKVLAASPAADRAAKLIPVWQAEVDRLRGVVSEQEKVADDKAQPEDARTLAKLVIEQTKKLLDEEYPADPNAVIVLEKPYKGGATKALSRYKDDVPKLTWNDEAARPRSFTVATYATKEQAEQVAAQVVGFFDLPDDEVPPTPEERGSALGDDAREVVFALLPVFGHTPRVEFVGPRAEWEKPAEKRTRKPRRDRKAEREKYVAEIYASLAPIIPDKDALDAAVGKLVANYDATHGFAK